MKIKNALIVLLPASMMILALAGITPTYSNPLTLIIDIVNMLNSGIIYFVLADLILFGTILYNDYRRMKKL